MLLEVPLFILAPLAHLAAVTVPLTAVDVRTLRLPNALVLPGLAVLCWALVWAAVVAPSVAGAGVTGAAAFGGVLLAGRMLGAVGMGDVKLGAWLGGLAGMTELLQRPESLARGALVAAAVAALLVARAARPAGTAATRGLEPRPATARTSAPAGPAATRRLEPCPATARTSAPAGLAATRGLEPCPATARTSLGSRIPFGPPLLAGFWAALVSTTFPTPTFPV